MKHRNKMFAVVLAAMGLTILASSKCLALDDIEGYFRDRLSESMNKEEQQQRMSQHLEDTLVTLLSAKKMTGQCPRTLAIGSSGIVCFSPVTMGRALWQIDAAEFENKNTAFRIMTVDSESYLIFLLRIGGAKNIEDLKKQGAVVGQEMLDSALSRASNKIHVARSAQALEKIKEEVGGKITLQQNHPYSFHNMWPN